MTAARRVRRTQWALALLAGMAALLWSAAAAAAVLAAAAAADVVFALPRDVRSAVVPVALAVSFAAGVAVAWRSRGVRAAGHVALWIEQQVPALRYALVTAVDPRYAGRLPAVDHVVARTSWTARVRDAVLRALLVPAALALGAAVLVALLPAGTVARVVTPRVGDAVRAAGTPVGADRLRPIVVTVRPPAYAARAQRVLEEPAVVPGLPGSTIRITGRGAPEGLTASLDGTEGAVRADGPRWRVEFTMPAVPGVVRLGAGGTDRLLALEPAPDSVPQVVLRLPPRDTVLREAAGRIAFLAEARDDLGLADLVLEYIVSAGQGESFRFRSGVLARRETAADTAALTATLEVAAFGLAPGDVVHLRAVARDRNDVTGPGAGVSETRTVRVAHPGEGDTSAVVVLPPLAGDTALISQRMLIQLTERLVARVPRLDRPVVVAESRAIGRDQARLRRQVADVVFMRLGGAEGEHAHGPEEPDEVLTPEGLLAAAEASVAEGAGEALDFHEDETPVVAVNRPLLEAYNAMWDAGRELDIGEPARALPHMHAALEAIQRARAAERIYLRARPPRVVLDLARIRLAGRRADAAPAQRPAGPADPRLALAQRFDAWFLRGHPPALADSLLVLRIDALAVDAGVAAALAVAAAEVRSGRDATDALVGARRRLAGPVRTVPGQPAWGTWWSP